METFSKKDNLRLFQANEKEARGLLSARSILIDYSELLGILLDSFALPSYLYSEVIHKRLSAAEMVALVEEHLTTLGEHVAVVTLQESIIPEEALEDSLTKAEVTVGNEKWRLHRYDADPFPSNPHAHNLATGLKLDLSNGKLYRRRTAVGQIHRKDLLNIRGQFGRARGITLPALAVKHASQP